MPVTLSDLLAEADLDLRLIVPPSANGGSAVTVSAVAPTELPDPSPYLDGGELVLTTGVRLRTEQQRRAFVKAVAAYGAAALGVGVSSPGSQLPWSAIPKAVAEEAQAQGLPLIEVPEPTPFVAVGRFVSTRTAQEHAAGVTGLLDAHRRLAAALLSGGRERGRQALLAELSRLIDGDARILRYGSLEAEATTGGRDETTTWTEQSIPTGFKDRATLATRPGPAAALHAQAAADYARSLLGVELANDNRALLREREAAGQVLRDIIEGRIRGAEAKARLESLGVDDGPHRIVVVRVPAPQRRSLAALTLGGRGNRGLEDLGIERTASIEDALVIVSLTAETAALHAALSRAGLAASVGVSRPYRRSGLTWAWHEARAAARAARPGETVHAQRLTLTSLLLASADAPTAELAEQTIRPLAAEGPHLVQTLRAYLRLDGAVQAVAAELGLHRNSVRHRMEQVRELTGHDPSRTDGLAHLYLAMSAWDLAHPAARPDSGREPAAPTGEMG
ncbi:helix-turn-helix domain-containing protein [Falsarthrobacter nasiphocae]|uniref:Purine catabolism regulator n=1 Tax=Falsarthrobacter nasiphocae TaxID=189863 RepID=A0AAE3YIM3_9MICC|nr:PucR family transcriptional regulator ligand-binding domain-containing protein [Falsarthrobacter nasiphocae]MDR6892441.1 purine catabolism regulator [Falsarthrobacter nasiphocae]